MYITQQKQGIIALDKTHTGIMQLKDISKPFHSLFPQPVVAVPDHTPSRLADEETHDGKSIGVYVCL